MYQTNRRLATEINIGFINHHHAIRVGLQDILYMPKSEVASRRRIRVREDNAAVVTFVVIRIDLEAVSQWNDRTFDLEQARVHRVEAIADIRKQDRLVVLQQALKYMGQ